jgi:hypothetical protein
MGLGADPTPGPHVYYGSWIFGPVGPTSERLPGPADWRQPTTCVGVSGGGIDSSKSYGFPGFGDIDAPNPYEFIGFGDIDAPNPYEFIGSGGCPGV